VAKRVLFVYVLFRYADWIFYSRFKNQVNKQEMIEH
jgi:hypothetical protein